VTSVNGGVVGNLNRSDLNPDLVFFDTAGDRIALAITDPIAMRRVDCLRAITAATLTENDPRAVAVLLSNGDLNLDIAVASITRAGVFFGDGLGGAMGGREIPISGGSAIVAADIDGDGSDELLIGTVNGNNVEFVTASSDIPAFKPLDVGAPVVAIAVADFNGDGLLDVLVLDQSSRLVYFPQDPAPPPPPTGTPVPGEDRRPDLFDEGDATTLIPDDPALQRVAFAIADPEGRDRLGFNGDSVPDIAVIGVRIAGSFEGRGELSILIGSRPGGLGYSVSAQAAIPLGGSAASSSAPSAVAVGDLDGDGALDVVVADRAANHILPFRGSGGGAMAAQDPLPTGGNPAVVLVDDFDSDGPLDIAVGNQADGSVTLFLSNRIQVATFTPTATNTETPTPSLTPTTTPTLTPSETPTEAPTNTAMPTRSLTPTRTTTPGFFEVRGEGCVVGTSTAGSGAAWIVMAGLLVAWLLRRGARGGGRGARG
jgi:hypothetical protein